MTPTETAMLQYVYEEYQKGYSMTYVIFNNFTDNLLDAQNALENLKSYGYIEVPGPAIGSAYVKITAFGISFFEESY